MWQKITRSNTINQNTIKTKAKQEQNEWDSSPQPAVLLFHALPIHHQDVHKGLRYNPSMPYGAWIQFAL